jgi:hypothetical protein
MAGGEAVVGRQTCRKDMSRQLVLAYLVQHGLLLLAGQCGQELTLDGSLQVT